MCASPRSLIARQLALLALFLLVFGAGRAAYSEGDAVEVASARANSSAPQSSDSADGEEQPSALAQAYSPAAGLQAVPGYPQALSDLWLSAAENHPSIKLLLSEADALQQRVPPAGAKPDPMLMISFNDHPIANPFSYDMPMTSDMVGIQQMLERGSKRKARMAVAQQDVVIQRLRIDAARYEFGDSLLDEWFDLAEAAVRLKQLERNKELLKALRDIARLEFEVNRVPLADVLAAEAELAEISTMKAELETMRRTLIASLASSAGLEMSRMPSLETVTLPDLRLAMPEDWQPVLDKVTLEHPDNRLLDALEEQLKLQREVLRLDYKADPTIEAGWGWSPREQDTISLSLSIPLLIHNAQRLDPQVEENRLRTEQIKTMREELMVKIRGNVQVEAARLGGLPAQKRALEELALPLLRQTFDSQLGAYQTGKIPFADLLRTTLNTVETETALLLLDVQESRAKAKLDYYTFGILRSEENGTAK